MAKLYFKYGTMNSGKSIELLKTAYNYEEQNKKVLLLTTATDDRDGIGVISSRIGLKRDAKCVENVNLRELVLSLTGCAYRITDKETVAIPRGSCVPQELHAILVDECQFLTRESVIELADIADEFGIPVMCFGLKNDFQNNLFEGSQALLIYADKLEEIKTICWDCDRKATMNGRVNEDGRVLVDGEQVMIGGNEDYLPLCRACYKSRMK